MDIWDVIRRYFNKSENWGDPDKVNPILLFIIYNIRDAVGKPFNIHNAFATAGHSEESQHYKGNAVDGHFKQVSFVEAISLVEQSLLYLKIDNKVGLGIYPHWDNPGFHLDVRGYKARWGRVDGKYVSFENALEVVKKLNF